ncbi:ankyrin-3-like [Copidosoma floridanum]|uniref:ankyrin-3-like n=1 Tax=Copidosoma floridanum TaxID=29053 RepID=UPI0006C93D04|nr:ankyrin-3-like [Copidosoma floridanum]
MHDVEAGTSLKRSHVKLDKAFEWLEELILRLRSYEESEIRSQLDHFPRLLEVHNHFGDSLLHMISRRGNSERIGFVAGYLIAAGCDVNGRNHFNNPPLQYAIWENDKWVAKALLDAGATVDNAFFDSNESPLHIAAYHGSLDVLELLLSQRDLDVNQVDCSGNTVLHSATACLPVVNDNTRVLEALINAGANVNAANNEGWTPLLYARKLNEVKLLLDRGANVNATSNSGQTALHQAVVNHAGVEVIRGLLVAGCDVNRLDRDHRSALHYAVEEFNEDLLKLLLGEGALVDVIDCDGLDPLCYGLSKAGNPDGNFFTVVLTMRRVMSCMELLFQHGARVNRADRSKSPMYIALNMRYDFNIIRCLLERGATFDLEDLIIKVVVSDEKSSDISKLLLARVAISNVVLGQVPTLAPLHRSYYEQCVNELQLLKDTPIEDTGEVFFKVLANSSIARFVQDKGIVKFFSDSTYAICEMFPIYGKELVKRFAREKHRQCLVSGAMQSLSCIMGVNQYSYHLIFHEIMGYLTEKDMTNLYLA